MSTEAASDVEILHRPKQAPLSDTFDKTPKPAIEQFSAARATVKTDSRQLPDGFAITVSLSSLALIVILIAIRAVIPSVGTLSATVAFALWTSVVFLMWRHLDQHPHATFGAANAVTLCRMVVTILFACLIPIAGNLTSQWVLWSIALIATMTLCMDGLDGYLARKFKHCSAFGARLDMETDALLALVITLFLWQSESAGIWVLGLGVFRYAFLAASIWVPALRQELFASMRRKTVCVIQVAALCLMLVPALSESQVSIIGIFALVFLIYSFAVDILWLLRRPDL